MIIYGSQTILNTIHELLRFLKTLHFQNKQKTLQCYTNLYVWQTDSALCYSCDRAECSSHLESLPLRSQHQRRRKCQRQENSFRAWASTVNIYISTSTYVFCLEMLFSTMNFYCGNCVGQYSTNVFCLEMLFSTMNFYCGNCVGQYRS